MCVNLLSPHSLYSITHTRTMSSTTHTPTLLSPHSLYSMHHCRSCCLGGGLFWEDVAPCESSG